MKLHLLIGFYASLCYANPTPTKPFLTKFDDIQGSGVDPELFPVPTPYDYLAYAGFNVYNATEGVSLIKAPSPPNFAASVTVLQMIQGSPAKITIAGTSTKSFALKTLYDACIVFSQTGALTEDCTIQYNGTKTTGEKVMATCKYTANLLAPQAAPCTLPSTFIGLKEVSLIPVNATLLPPSTILFIDNVNGTATF